MFFPSDLSARARDVVESYAARKKKIVTAESCTGGLVAAALTAIPGASAVFERGFITYSYDSKTDVLGVLPEILKSCGAVSAEVAEAMARGALDYALADVAVAVTGIAGPDGGLPGKPVGLTYFGLATREGACFHLCATYTGDRDTVRSQCVAEALDLLRSALPDREGFDSLRDSRKGT